MITLSPFLSRTTLAPPRTRSREATLDLEAQDIGGMIAAPDRDPFAF